jgi:hypothetical protein
MRILDLLRASLRASGRLKSLIMFFAVAHAVFLFFGQWTVARGIPGVLSLRAEQLKAIQELYYLKPLTGVLAENLVLKVLYTFSFNLVFGALLSTTAAGVVFFLPYLMAVWRSFIIGVLYYGTDGGPAMAAVFYGTFILEFGAYCLSSAAGTDIGLSLLWPRRKGTASRREAVNAAVRNASNIYVLVAFVLFIGAIWEISWLHWVGPLIKFEELK